MAVARSSLRTVHNAFFVGLRSWFIYISLAPCFSFQLIFDGSYPLFSAYCTQRFLCGELKLGMVLFCFCIIIALSFNVTFRMPISDHGEADSIRVLEDTPGQLAGLQTFVHRGSGVWRLRLARR